MEVELESQTQCKLNTQGYDNMVYASGAFKTMNLEETESEVEIQTTVIPDSIRMLEEANRSSLSLTLPSNIPGITLKYMNPDGGAYDYSNQEDNSQSTFTDHQFKLESEFLPINKSIENGHFVYKYGKGELFRINEFEYETSKHEGKDIINIHIPAKTKLDVCENLKSFKGAIEFFDKFYPEFKMIGLKCESWLLSRQIEEVMEGPTNISRFGDMFDHYDIGDEWGDAVFRFVYNFAAPYPPVEDVPENTTLQKKLKAYMLLGKRVYAMGGTISRQKLEEKLKEFEV